MDDELKRDISWYVIAPFLFIILITILVCWNSQELFSDSLLSVGLTVVGTAIVSLTSVFAVYIFLPKVRVWMALLVLFFHGAAQIMIFAAVYRGYGMITAIGCQGTAHCDVEPAWHLAIYLSAVIWTTLGIGDYLPRAGIELVAAFQALLGIFFIGGGVGLATELFARLEESVKKSSHTAEEESQ
jgi:hypothetical protein